MLALTVASLAAKNNADSSSCGSATNPNATMRVHRYAGSGAWNTSRSHQLASSLETQVICDPGTDVANAWHSQNGQDRRALHILGGKGFFVDMAANKPVTDSNTRSLERDHGWRGLCVDGNVAALPELARRRSCTVAGAIVSSMSDAHVQYRRWQGNWKPGVQLDGMSGIVSEGMGNTAKKTCWGVGSASGTGWPCLKIDTRDTARTARDEPGITVTLHALLRHFDAPKVIDYMSLDVEGAEEKVLTGFAFADYRFRMMTIERPSKRLREMLRANSYSYICDNGPWGDELWVHDEQKPKLPEDLRFGPLSSANAHRRCPNLK